MTTAPPPPPPPPPKGMSRPLILCLQFPIVQYSPAVCYYTALPWLPMSIKHYISSALRRQCKSKFTAHLPGYPRPAQGLSVAVVTNDWCINYSLWLWCTSHENLVFSPPPPPPQKKKKKKKKQIDPKHKIWHPLTYFSTYFQVHPTPSLVSLSDPNC